MSAGRAGAEIVDVSDAGATGVAGCAASAILAWPACLRDHDRAVMTGSILMRHKGDVRDSHRGEIRARHRKLGAPPLGT